jgi:cytochrome c oxidase subunit II
MIRNFKALAIAAVISLSAALPNAVSAQEAPAVTASAPTPAPVVDPAPAAPAAVVPEAAAAPAVAAPPVAAPTPLKPIAGIGQPVQGGIWFQPTVTPTGHYAHWMYMDLLIPLITVISLFVLGLLLWVMARYRRAANPVPSKVSHNTTIEIVWTLLPVFILIGVAVPSIDLLAKQFKPAPADALTVKVTGYQWYWGYEYPDNGIGEYVSNMLPPEKALDAGEPVQLGADRRLVLPVGRPIKLIVTGADVIHSFAVPAFWAKIDAVPGKLNEISFTIEKPGVYYGQCSELCGARHGFMPIAVEALPKAQFEQWVRSQGGTIGGEAAKAETAAAAAPATKS